MANCNQRVLVTRTTCLIIQPCLSKFLGRSESAVLQQIHFWITSKNNYGKIFCGKRWIYNSYQSWQKNIQIYSISTIRRAISKLENMDVIQSEYLSEKGSDRTKWYTINYDKIELILNKTPTSNKSEIPHNNDQHLSKRSTSYVHDEHMLIETEITSKNKSSPNSLENDVGDTLASELLCIWNTCLGDTRSLTKRRSCYLKSAFKLKFNGCINQWKRFCETIASSDFLMGRVKSTFKASLDWVLKFDIIQRILEGDFGVKKEENWPSKILCEKSQNNTEQEYIQTQHEPDEIKKLRMKLLQKIGEGAYKSWFKNVLLVEENFKIHLKCPNQFWRDYINANFYKTINLLSIVVDKV